MSGRHDIVGRLDPGQIRLRDIPRPSRDLVEGFLGLPDLTGMVCDVIDEFGLPMRTVSASVLPPRHPGARICGPALTVRNVPRNESLAAAVQSGRNGLGEIEAHNLAEEGDVLVIEGPSDCSNLGGNTRMIGRREGEIGAIVDGGVRDIGGAEEAGLAVWSRTVTPVTGKWRLQTEEINGAVVIAGVTVYPGDLVFADDNGIVFLASGRAEDVLARARELAMSEQKRQAAMRSGAGLRELAGIRPK